MSMPETFSWSQTVRLIPWQTVRAMVCGTCWLALACGATAWLGGVAYAAETGAEDNTPRSLLERGKQLEAAKRYRDAIVAYRAYLAVKPESDEVRATVAKLLSWEGQYEEAAAGYREVLSRHPLDYDSRIGLARVLAWQKQFDASKEQYEFVLRDEPQQVEALAGLADVLLWSGHPEQALPYYERVFSTTGDAELAARIHALKVDLAAGTAAAASDRAAQPVPDSVRHELERLIEQGRQLEGEKNYTAAAARYREVLALQPDNDEVRAKLARVLSWQGAHGEAVALYREVLARHPDDHESRVALARVLSWQKEFGEAERQYEEVLQADPANFEARRGLAEVAHWQGHRSEALARYEALAAETHDPDVERRLQAVKSELLVSPRAAVGQGLTGLRLPYRDYAKIGYGYYSYTKGIPNERDVLLEVAKPIGNQTLVMRVEPLNRFGEHDTPFSAEYYSPLWQRAWGYVAAQGTINPHFAPNYSFVGEIAQGLGGLHAALAPVEVSFGYRRLNYKSDDIDLFLPAMTLFLPFNLWLTEKIYYVPNTGAITLSSQLTWRPTDRLQVFASGSFGTSGERIVATQDFARVPTWTIQGGGTVPIDRRISVEASGFYEDRTTLYVRRGGSLNLIYHW